MKKKPSAVKKVRLSSLHFNAGTQSLDCCCGAVELGPLDAAEWDILDPIYSYAKRFLRGPSYCEPLVFFTDAVVNENGATLVSFIRKNKLGTVRKGPDVRNPNSGNIITGWIWAVDAAAFQNWCSQHIEA